MRISDWSSDVCSSDLNEFDWPAGEEMAHQERLVSGSSGHKAPTARLERQSGFPGESGAAASPRPGLRVAVPRPRLGRQARRLVSSKYFEIGRAACRERVCQYV